MQRATIGRVDTLTVSREAALTAGPVRLAPALARLRRPRRA
mgnify:CR=1 FL=1